VIKAFDKKGPHAGKFSVKYKDDPNWWTHSLLREGYGKDKHWVLLWLPSRDSASALINSKGLIAGHHVQPHTCEPSPHAHPQQPSVICCPDLYTNASRAQCRHVSLRAS
jgi:hypothetical protein